MLDRNMLELVEKYLSVYNSISKNENESIEKLYLKKLIASSMLNNIILSKKIFNRNILIENFLKEYFEIELSKSSFKSRTIICGKITRYINDIDDKNRLNEILSVMFSILIKIEREEDIFSKDIYDVIRGINL